MTGDKQETATDQKPKEAVDLTQEQQERLMRAALDEARQGMSEGEAPIGCVIAMRENDDVQIVARGHNQMNRLQRRNAHAEIMAFEHSGSVNGEPPALPFDAKDVIMVSTLEPCVMCTGAAMEAGVSLVLFGLQAPADNGTQRIKPPQSPESSNPTIAGGILAGKAAHFFKEWLKGKEGTEQAKFVEQLLALTE